MRNVCTVRGIIVGEMNLFPGVSWIGYIMGISQGSLEFFHRVGGVFRLFFCLVLLAFIFLQLRRAEGEGSRSQDYICLFTV